MIELFSVYDSAAAKFMDIFCAPTIDFALRGFKEACMTEGHQFSRFPEDYVLWKVGSFDSDKGTVVEEIAVKVALATSFTTSLPFPVKELTEKDVEGLYNGETIKREGESNVSEREA